MMGKKGLIRSLSRKILYHGSDMIVDNPGENYSRPESEFGYGFYISVSKRYADNRGESKADDKHYVNAYIFDDKYKVEKGVRERDDLNIYRFQTEEEWLDYVLAERRISKQYGDYDILIGPIMDDGAVTILDDAIDAEKEGIPIDKADLMKDLKAQRNVNVPLDFGKDISNQYVFKTRKSLKHLIHLGGEKR